jgi:hypothetical protein
VRKSDRFEERLAASDGVELALRKEIGELRARVAEQDRAFETRVGVPRDAAARLAKLGDADAKFAEAGASLPRFFPAILST